MSSSTTPCDLGIRQAWLAIFDRYRVDLVLTGHAHDYERTYPVRGVDPPSGTVTAAFDNYAVGDTFDTRRPHTVTTQPAVIDGTPAWNTSQGTVYMVLGTGGVPLALPYETDPANGMRRAALWNIVNGANVAENAPWSAGRDPSGAHGYAIFDVDPGERPGETTITMSYYQVPTVAAGQTATMPTTPFETHIFGRKVPAASSGTGGDSKPQTLPQPTGG